jgi:cytochrome c-type biogenesis protein CcmE
MDPSRKRKIRLFVALGAALVLAGALLYTSFGSAATALSPSQALAKGSSDGTYELTGKVVPGTIRHSGAGDTLVFRVRDRAGTESVPVSYSGLVSDTFRGGREIIVTGKLDNGVFKGRRDTLTTKCPSKFQKKPSGSTL